MRFGVDSDGMRVPQSLRRRAAILAVAAGFAVYAASLVGLSSIDDDLRAAGLATTTSQKEEVVRVTHHEVRDDGCRDDERPLGREL